MKADKKFLIGFIIIIVLVLGFWIWKGPRVVIVTDKKEYLSDQSLRVNIKNNLKENICFSSCYPYYLENKKGEWQSYQYGECPKPNLAEKCMKPTEIKGFELTLVNAEEGLHRLAVPVCIDCKEGEEFKEAKRFYSNKFIVR